MKDYIIFTDSSCDLPAKMAEDLEVDVVPLTVRMDGEEFTNYLDWREITPQEFYKKLHTAKDVQTSAPPVDAFLSVLEKAHEAGRDALYIGFTSALSSTYQTACVAADIAADKYPDMKIKMIDTSCAGMGQGLIVHLAVMYKRRGKTLEETAEYVEKLCPRVWHLISVADLKHIYRGGRISAASLAVGMLLKIRPLMCIDANGYVSPLRKLRTKKALISAYVEKFRETVIRPATQIIYIGHADCEDDAKELAHRLRDECGVKNFIINHIGPVIGAHGGPGSMALFYVGEPR